MIEFTMEHGTFNFLLKHVHANLDLLKIAKFSTLKEL